MATSSSAGVLLVVGCAAVVALEGVALARWQGWISGRAKAVAPQPPPVQAQPLPDLSAQQAPAPQPAELSPTQRHYSHLRERVRWVQTRLGREWHVTPDAASRMMIAKSAARQARLHEVGLGFEDVYGLINAETSWVPRDGSSRDGTPNLGIAQFEPETAQALGVRNPHDLVEAVHAAARHMKEAAQWSHQRIAGLRLEPDERAARLREGVSIYYNLSSKGRSVWNGRNTEALPTETQQHIRNARIGSQEATFLETQLQGPKRQRKQRAVMTAGTSPGRG